MATGVLTFVAAPPDAGGGWSEKLTFPLASVLRYTGWAAVQLASSRRPTATRKVAGFIRISPVLRLAGLPTIKRAEVPPFPDAAAALPEPGHDPGTP